jgi:hypothetical protein
MLGHQLVDANQGENREAKTNKTFFGKKYIVECKRPDQISEGKKLTK